MIEYLTKSAEININQREEEGVDVTEFRKAFEAASSAPEFQRCSAFLTLIDELEKAPIKPGFPYDEPNGLGRIRESAPGIEQNSVELEEEAVRDKILGGWQGRAAGCRLGKPIEGTPKGFKKEDIEQYLRERELWPITGYFDRGEPMCAVDATLPRPFPGMPHDDDIDYVLLNLLILENHGKDWTHEQAGQIWRRHTAVDCIFAAGKAALVNYTLGFLPPKTGTWANPCRQSLGAMIRCDTWGWVCPGDPTSASELAYRDAVISQTTNGVYSGMFFAAMIAQAFVEADIYSLVQTGLSVIPPDSRLAEAVKYTLWCWDDHGTWQGAIDDIYHKYGDQYFNHSVINACIVLVGLLSGAGDFEKTIIDTVKSGFDTDCTGATAGSICGVIHGASGLPQKWVEPLNDSYETLLTGLTIQKFTNLAQRTARIALG